MAQGVKAGEAYVRLSLDNKMQQGINNASKSLKAFGASVGQVGMAMAKLSAAMALPLGYSVRTFAGFADKMAEVRAVTAATESDFVKLTESAKELGRTTSFTAQQVAEGMGELGRAGFKTSEILQTIPNVLNLARSTSTELALAAEIAGASLRGFGLDANESQRVIDVLASTANNSAQKLEDVGEAMKYVAPIAAEAGESIEDTAAALGVMANNGIKGSLAGNALARAFKNLAMPDAQQELRGLGIEAIDSSGNIRKVADILSELGIIAKNMGSAQRLAIFESLFGRGQAAALKLASVNSNLKDLQTTLKTSSGYAERTAKTMDDVLGGSFRMLMSAVEGIQIAIGDSLNNTIRNWADALTDLSGDITEFIKRNNELIVSILKASAAIGAIGVGMIALGATATSLGFIIGGLAPVLNTTVIAFTGFWSVVKYTALGIERLIPLIISFTTTAVIPATKELIALTVKALVPLISKMVAFAYVTLTAEISLKGFIAATVALSGKMLTASKSVVFFFAGMKDSVVAATLALRAFIATAIIPATKEIVALTVKALVPLIGKIVAFTYVTATAEITVKGFLSSIILMSGKLWGAVKAIGAFFVGLKTLVFAFSAASAGALLAGETVLMVIGAISVAATALTAVLLAVPVAFAGWKFGKWISDFTGISNALEKIYGWFLRIGQVKGNEQIIAAWKKQGLSEDELNKRIALLSELEKKRGTSTFTKEKTGGESAQYINPESAEFEIKNRKEISKMLLEIIKDEKEKELKLLEMTHNDEVNEAKAKGFELTSLLEKQNIERELVNKKYREKENAERTDALNDKIKNEEYFMERLSEMYASQIEDDTERQIALIKLRYDKEIKEAERAGYQTIALEQAKDIEIRKLIEDRKIAEAEKRTGFEKDFELKNQELLLELNYKGVELERKKLELSKQRAIEEAKIVGANTEQIEKYYDLQSKIIDNALIERTKKPLGIEASTSSAGSFSAQAGRILSVTTIQSRTAKATEETAKNTRKMLDSGGLAFG